MKTVACTLVLADEAGEFDSPSLCTRLASFHSPEPQLGHDTPLDILEVFRVQVRRKSRKAYRTFAGAGCTLIGAVLKRCSACHTS